MLETRAGLAALVPSALLSIIPGLATGMIEWDPPEVVDREGLEVSTPAGTSIVYFAGDWHVVYQKPSSVVHCVRAGGAWSRVAEFSGARSAHLAHHDDDLFVVYEADAFASTEVFVAQGDGTSWSAPECVSCDSPDPSSGPVVAGTDDGARRALVVWEDETASGSSIRGRLHDDGSWDDVFDVSGTPGSAHVPSVTDYPAFGWFTVVYEDLDGPLTQLFARTLSPDDGWGSIEQLTDLSGNCTSPSVHANFCCPDLAYPHFRTLFEFTPPDPESVSEIWECNHSGTLLVGGAVPVSPEDGVPSVSPNLDGFFVDLGWPAFEWDWLGTWTDLPPGGEPVHTFAHSIGDLGFGDVMTLTPSGIRHVAVGGENPVSEPRARILVLWDESTPEGPFIMARHGTYRSPIGADSPPTVPDTPALGVTPNPARRSVAITLRLPDRSSDVRVEVLDVTGRRVRDLGPVPPLGREATVRWDTEDESGRVVAPGTFYVRVTGSHVTWTAPVRILR